MKNVFFTLKLILLLFSFLILVSCRDKSINENVDPFYQYEIPSKIDDDWEVASVEDVDLDKDKLTKMIDEISNMPDHKIHSILIVKDSKLVFEKYFKGFLFDTDYIQSEGDLIQYDENTLHYLASVTKSITSIILGIAIDKGLDIDVNKLLLEYYPEYSDILIDDKASITIKNLLTMSAGLDWNEAYYSYTDPRNDVFILFSNDDPIKYILQKNIVTKPGERFYYNSGYTNIIADIIQKKIGVPFFKFAEENLFTPLKINNYRWDEINNELIFASGGLYLTPRSLAKIGEVFLNGGKWKDEPIISKDWIDESTQAYINPNYYFFADGYGYQWWNYNFTNYEKTYSCYFAAGWGEQFLYIFPEQNMEIIITSGYFFTYDGITPHEIVSDYILNSIK
ncbi:MAG: serine hydrolase [Ignavibacteriae bacterium]|nr:serine hydrolase [Ignavibacteriota bacterium]